MAAFLYVRPESLSLSCMRTLTPVLRHKYLDSAALETPSLKLKHVPFKHVSNDYASTLAHKTSETKTKTSCKKEQPHNARLNPGLQLVTDVAKLGSWLIDVRNAAEDRESLGRSWSCDSARYSEPRYVAANH
jgi:hypothetical protein